MEKSCLAAKELKETAGKLLSQGRPSSEFLNCTKQSIEPGYIYTHPPTHQTHAIKTKQKLWSGHNSLTQ